jgi:tRNA(Ile)-lysidine synthase
MPDIAALTEKALGRPLSDGERLAVAVSGGPDSVALLQLAARCWPGRVTALTVDHGLRADAAAEAAAVVAQCRAAGIPVQAFVWDAPKPAANLAAAARDARYRLMGEWCAGAGVGLLLTAHHADDQAETLLMRLGQAGGPALAGIRALRPLRAGVTLVRPLLGVTKAELVALAEASGWQLADDPGNRDAVRARGRARALLAETPWLPAAGLAAAAAHVAEAEAALDWVVERAWAGRAGAGRSERQGPALSLDTAGLPALLVRRLVLRALAELGVAAPRAGDVERLLAVLAAGRTATLGGVKVRGGDLWRFEPAPPRRQIAANKGQNAPKSG